MIHGRLLSVFGEAHGSSCHAVRRGSPVLFYLPAQSYLSFDPFALTVHARMCVCVSPATFAKDVHIGLVLCGLLGGD